MVCDEICGSAVAGPSERTGVHVLLTSGGGLDWQQPGESHQVVGGCDEIASQFGAGQTTEARPSEATNRFHPAKDLFSGLFTNDKFCWSRPAKLRLKWWHRAYRDR